MKKKKRKERGNDDGVSSDLEMPSE